MSTLLDRLDQGIERFARGVQEGFERSRLNLEKARLQSRRGEVAAKLGLLVHRTERKDQEDPELHEALCLELDDLEAKLDKVEQQLATIRADEVRVTVPDEGERAEEEKEEEAGSETP